MTRVFIILIVFFNYSCQDVVTKEKSRKNLDTAFINKTKRDSIRRYTIFDAYDKIRISKYWQSTTDENCYVEFALDTEPMIYIDFKTKLQYESKRFKSIMDYGDSLSITTQEYNKERLIIWTFKPKGKYNGIWSKHVPELNSYKILGVFKPLDHYE